MNANSLVAVITKNRTNPAYVGARLGADRVLSANALSSVSYVSENPDDIFEQRDLVRKAIKLSPTAIFWRPLMRLI